MINRDRLAATFKHLVEIDSVSRKEKNVADEIVKILAALGAGIVFDGSKNKTGSNTGNLTARISGSVDVPPMLLSSHMDTVEPGQGIKAVFKDGIFKSDGMTILGSDDKSAIAIILETIKALQENSIPHGPLELVFTVCEEIGLLGAKHLDYSLFNSRFGYVLDSTDLEGIVIRAPAANRFEFNIHGKDAHAGAHPEEGINAIQLASRAIAGLDLGRIDHETTCNIGRIEGGVATNIVPSLVRVKGEVRSHNNEKLKEVTDNIVKAFKEAVKAEGGDTSDDIPCVELNVSEDFPRTDVPEDHELVLLVKNAATNLGREMRTKATGGGADSNIFFGRGIMTGVLGTGMQDVHTVRESIRLDDMVKTAELLMEIIRLHGEKK